MKENTMYIIQLLLNREREEKKQIYFLEKSGLDYKTNQKALKKCGNCQHLQNPKNNFRFVI